MSAFVLKPAVECENVRIIDIEKVEDRHAAMDAIEAQALDLGYKVRRTAPTTYVVYGRK